MADKVIEDIKKILSDFLSPLYPECNERWGRELHPDAMYDTASTFIMFKLWILINLWEHCI